MGYGQYDYVELGTRSLGTWDEAGKGWAEMWSKAEESEAAQSGPAGLVYEGETQDHLRHGQGQLTFVGESAEQEEGLGQLDVSKLGEEGWTLEEVLEKWGGRFIGAFFNDAPHGPALLFLSNGQSFALTLDHGKVVK